MRPRHQWLYIVFAGIVAVSVVLGLAPGVGATAFAGAYTVGALVGLFYSVRAARHPRLEQAIRRPWRYLAAVFVLDFVIGAASLPLSDADVLADLAFSPLLVLGLVGMLAQTACLVAALLSYASVPLPRSGRRQLAMDVLTVVGAASMVLWYTLVWPAAAGLTSRLSLPAICYDSTALISDLASIVAITTVHLRGTVPDVRRPVRLVLASVSGFLVWDLWTISTHVHGRTEVSSIVSQLMVLVPLFLMVAAAVEQCRAVNAAPASRRAAPSARRPSALPYVALTAGFAVLVTASLRQGGPAWLGLVAGATVMTFGVAVRQHISLRETYALAHTDPLTGLANRARLRMALHAAITASPRTGRTTGVLLIDLDGFKLINDTHGHEVGDELLITFAHLLRGAVRPTDTPARWGGDEYVVLLHDIGGIHQATAVAQRILAAAEHPVEIRGRTLRIRASIGIALADPQQPDLTPEEVLHQADQAMYRAKRSPKSGWAVAGLHDQMTAPHGDCLTSGVPGSGGSSAIA